jgi:hypothetical protein
MMNDAHNTRKTDSTDSVPVSTKKSKLPEHEADRSSLFITKVISHASYTLFVVVFKS